MSVVETDWHQAHMAMILEHPAADLPRLVLADRLEENGEPERAEFIRLQIEIAAIPTRPASARRKRPYTKTDAAKVEPLHRREQELIRKVFTGPGVYSGYGASIGRSPTTTMYTVRRGFIAEVRCPLFFWMGGECRYCRQWLGRWRNRGTGAASVPPWCDVCQSNTGRTSANGPRLVREHPVDVVTVTDRQPIHLPGRSGAVESGWHWAVGDDRGSVPWSVYQRLATLVSPTREGADAALSDALIKWARAGG